MSLQSEYNQTKRWLEGGNECRGKATCSGWHNSDFDTWHECPCGNGRHSHPEFGITLPTPASPVWVAAVKGLPFYWASTFAKVSAHAAEIAERNGLVVALSKIDNADDFTVAFPADAQNHGEYGEFEPFTCPRCLDLSVDKAYQALCDACNELPEKQRLTPPPKTTPLPGSRDNVVAAEQRECEALDREDAHAFINALTLPLRNGDLS